MSGPLCVFPKNTRNYAPYRVKGNKMAKFGTLQAAAELIEVVVKLVKLCDEEKGESDLRSDVQDLLTAAYRELYY